MLYNAYFLRLFRNQLECKADVVGRLIHRFAFKLVDLVKLGHTTVVIYVFVTVGAKKSSDFICYCRHQKL